jgi:hypothetical protein
MMPISTTQASSLSPASMSSPVHWLKAVKAVSKTGATENLQRLKDLAMMMPDISSPPREPLRLVLLKIQSMIDSRMRFSPDLEALVQEILEAYLSSKQRSPT